MKKKSIFLLLGLAGCSTNQGFDRNDPIDNALKACGLGYASEIRGNFKAAYDYADRSGEADFEAKFDEGLETQIGALTKNESFNKGMSPKEKIDLIKSTRSCVMTFADTYRPKSRSELISECIKDLQHRITGEGSATQVITVKNWVVKKDHKLYSDKNPIVYAELDYHRTFNRIKPILLMCKTNNYKYQGLEPIDH